MPHVEGDDDGVGYGVYGKQQQRLCVNGKSNGYVYQQQEQWCVWEQRRRLRCILASAAMALVCMAKSGINHVAILNGKVKITGNLEKVGGSFKIDHPLDPYEQIPLPLLCIVARYEERL